MELFVSKDEKIQSFEKRLAELERTVDRRFSQMGESFDAFRKIILDMKTENAEIKKDRDFLMERYKEMLRRLDLPLVTPIKESIKETSNLVRDIVLEDFDKEKRPGADDLFELVMKRRKIAAGSAARELGVTEEKAVHMAERLEKNGLIQVSKKSGRIEFLKR